MTTKEDNIIRHLLFVYRQMNLIINFFDSIVWKYLIRIIVCKYTAFYLIYQIKKTKNVNKIYYLCN
jgi:hypothetical protein